MKNNKIIYAVILAAFCVLILGACFSDWMPEGSNTGTIKISLGGSGAHPSGARSVHSEIVGELRYKIILKSGRMEIMIPEDGEELIKDDIEVTLRVGVWNIQLDAYYDGNLYATGSTPVDVTAEMNETIEIKMTKKVNHYFDVANTNDWINAIELIKRYGAGIYEINVMNSFSVPGSTSATFGDKKGINVTINGKNHELSLTESTNILHFVSGQTGIINDVHLVGIYNNSQQMILVGEGARLTMNGGSIKDNKRNTSADGTSAGAVHVEGGVFIMNSGTISGNRAHSGGGVRVGGSQLNPGTFIMNGGDIFDNYARRGGGVAIATGTFIMNNGNIFRNSANDEGDFNMGEGGGVTLMAGASIFIMNGGRIYGNSASIRGGGINLRGTTYFINGIVTGNTEYDGLAANIAQSGDAIFRTSGTLQHGTFSNPIVGNTVFFNSWSGNYFLLENNARNTYLHINNGELR
ncbi:MAG: hypothetical protein FWD13_01985 [Treponema sp.]|nr:hypothetical protein [Treponema sp.]